VLFDIGKKFRKTASGVHVVLNNKVRPVTGVTDQKNGAPVDVL